MTQPNIFEKELSKKKSSKIPNLDWNFDILGEI